MSVGGVSIGSYSQPTPYVPPPYTPPHVEFRLIKTGEDYGVFIRQSDNWIRPTTTEGNTDTDIKEGYIFSACVAPDNIDRLYAFAADAIGYTNGRFYTSFDAGVNWSEMTVPAADVFSSLECQKEGTVYAGGTDGIYKTTNHGATWSLVTNTPNIHSIKLVGDRIWMVKGNPTRSVAFINTDGTGFTDITTSSTFAGDMISSASYDHAISAKLSAGVYKYWEWDELEDITPIGTLDVGEQIFEVVALTNRTYLLLTHLSGSGETSIDRIWKTSNGGSSWTLKFTFPAGDGPTTYAADDYPQFATKLGNYNLVIVNGNAHFDHQHSVYISNDAGETWTKDLNVADIQVLGNYIGGGPGGINIEDGTQYYSGTAKALLGTDDYNHKFTATPRVWEEALNGGFNLFISQIEAVRNQSGKAYAFNPFNNGATQQWVTTDFAGTWTNWTKPSFTITFGSFPWRIMYGLQAPKDNDIYVVEVYRLNSGDSARAVAIWKTTNSGSSWTRIVGDSVTQFNGGSNLRNLFVNTNYMYLLKNGNTSSLDTVSAGVTRYALDGTGATDILLPYSTGSWRSNTVQGDPTDTDIAYMVGNHSVNGRELFRINGTTVTEITPPYVDPINSNEIFFSVDGINIICWVPGYDSGFIITGEIWKSTNRGDSWTKVRGPSRDLATNSASSSTNKPVFMRGSDVFVMTQPNSASLGYENGNLIVHSSQDGGATWGYAMDGLLPPYIYDVDSKFNLPSDILIFKP